MLQWSIVPYDYTSAHSTAWVEWFHCLQQGIGFTVPDLWSVPYLPEGFTALDPNPSDLHPDDFTLNKAAMSIGPMLLKAAGHCYKSCKVLTDAIQACTPQSRIAFRFIAAGTQSDARPACTKLNLNSTLDRKWCLLVWYRNEILAGHKQQSCPLRKSLIFVFSTLQQGSKPAWAIYT